jgi:DNA ligase 1
VGDGVLRLHNGAVEFAQIVAASEQAAATTSKKAKSQIFAVVIAELADWEIEPVIGFLIAAPRQGRLGVGWAQVSAAMTDLGERRLEADALSVTDVDSTLERLAAMAGAGVQVRRRAELDELFGRATEVEARFLRGLLLGENRVGALEGIVTEAVALGCGVMPGNLRRASMLCGSLGAAARVARSTGDGGLLNVGLVVGRPVQPMLAATAATIAEAIEQVGEASVEWKLDGARIQVHRRGDEVRIFTRNLNEITERLPQVVDIIRSFPGTECVLDGEILGLDLDGRPRPFQDTMSRFGSDEVGAGVGLMPYFFDVLHLDGRDLLNEPLQARQAVLGELAMDWRLPTLRTADPALAAAFGAEALEAGHEGVMVKAIDSRYDAGRRGSQWLKVKPVRTLDLVVLAAEWGHGRRTGWLSNLHLGARGPDGNFVMVGKTFKGLTDELLRWQTMALQELATTSDGWIVHVRPELVVEIALDGVQVSRRYPGGVALRFARVRGYRPDRSAGSADTIGAVQAMLVPNAVAPDR